MTQIKGSVTRTTGTMSERESINAFADGAFKAYYAAMELAKVTNDKDWIGIATMLEGMRVNVLKLADMRSISRIENMMAANLKLGKK